MAFTFSDPQIVQINAALTTAEAAAAAGAVGAYVPAYNLVSSIISDVVGGKLVPKAGVDPASWVFLQGVHEVNGNDTGSNFNNFIRAYTKIQYETRFGTPATEKQVQDASNGIAARILSDIVTRKTVPTIGNIATNDAQVAAEFLFDQGQIAGWAGNPMLVPVGHSNSYRNNILHANGDKTDTYDMLAVVHSMIEAADEVGLADTATLVYDILTKIFPTAAGNVAQGVVNAADIALLISDTNTQIYDAYDKKLSLSDLLGTAAPYSDFDDIYLGTFNNDLMNEGDWADDDVMHGGAGNDTIMGTQGDDILDGGTGIDWVDYSVFDAAWDNDTEVDLIKHFATTEYLALDDTDQVFNIENVKTGSGDDTITGSKENNLLVSGKGDDTFKGKSEGDDTIDAGDDNDVIDMFGKGNVKIYLGKGNDTVEAAPLGSVIEGGAGNDTFGLGKDILIADANTEDAFRYLDFTLTGGIRNKASELPWSNGKYGVQYAKNINNELVIKSPVMLDSKWTYVANYGATLDSPMPGNILLVEMLNTAYRLLETPNGWQFESTMKGLLGYALKAMTGKSYYMGVDPLVLDVGGDGRVHAHEQHDGQRRQYGFHGQPARYGMDGIEDHQRDGGDPAGRRRLWHAH